MTHCEAVIIAIVAMAVSFVMTGVVRKFAVSRGILDIPNERSSHTAPVPRSGGIAIVLSISAVSVALFLRGTIEFNFLLALSGGGIAVAIVGYLDDRYQLSAGTRFTVHIVAALWALVCLNGLAPLRLGDQIIELGWAGYVFGAAGIVWTLNLFNFMDGIDGIAASEATFVTGAGAAICFIDANAPAVPATAVTVAAASSGFLIWNWPRAKIFMGDSGSGYLGFVIAVLAIAAAHQNAVAALVWLLLGAVFFVDATVTLLRRLIRGEKVYEAHRTHAYQILARRWRSHRSVTLFVLLIDVVLLLPLAWLAMRHPSWAWWMVLAALGALSIGALRIGAGSVQPAS